MVGRRSTSFTFLLSLMEDFWKDISFKFDPKNYNFLDQVRKKLGTSFIRVSVNKEASESHGQFDEALQEYFKCHVITSAALNVLDSTQYFSNPVKSSDIKATSQNAYGNIHSLHLKTILKYMPELKAPFHPDQISKILEKKKKSQAKLAEHTNLVEDKINEFCKTLNDYTGQSDFYTTNWIKAFQESVPYLLSIAEVLDCTKAAKCQKRLLLKEMLRIYYGELIEGAAMSKELFRLCEEKFSMQLNLSEMCVERSLCLLCNVRMTELTTLNETYHEEALLALRMISDELDSKREHLLQEKENKMVTLQAYQILGPDYERLVESYTDLAERVVSKKWAIEAFKSRMDR